MNADTVTYMQAHFHHSSSMSLGRRPLMVAELRSSLVSPIVCINLFLLQRARLEIEAEKLFLESS